MSRIRQYPLSKIGGAPWIVECTGAYSLAEHLSHERAELEAILLDFGAILFRGFGIESDAHFADIVASFSAEKLDYLYRSTPRTSVAPGVFTASEYPATEEIPLHNENAYQRRWPKRLLLCCRQPATSGGETPLADMRSVTASIGSSLVDEFSSRRVMYVRHYRPYVDLSWQTVFQARDHADVAHYCESQGIDHEWLDEKTLRTRQVCQGVASHPKSGERFFFNQAHLFHVSNLGQAAAAVLLQKFGADLLPRNALFGDYGEISPDYLERVRSAFSRHAVPLCWQAGDVALIDNMRMAHGRRPYTGARRVLVALLDPVEGSSS